MLYCCDDVGAYFAEKNLIVRDVIDVKQGTKNAREHISTPTLIQISKINGDLSHVRHGVVRETNGTILR